MIDGEALQMGELLQGVHIKIIVFKVFLRICTGIDPTARISGPLKQPVGKIFDFGCCFPQRHAPLSVIMRAMMIFNKNTFSFLGYKVIEKHAQLRWHIVLL